MLVLDTNVISEVMRGPGCDPQVRRWVRELVETPVTTVLNRAEILAGLAVLPDGQRKTALTGAADRVFDRLGVVLPLVEESAMRYAHLVARRRAGGRPLDAMDGLIAAIALEAGAEMATRNVRDFEGLGLDLTDPWSA